MSSVFVMFPPGSGGNHFKNLICLSNQFDNSTRKLMEDFYVGNRRSVHLIPGNNFKPELLSIPTNEKTQIIMHGHFGEMATYRDEIIKIKNKKFILISLEESDDRELLKQRRARLGYPIWGGYCVSEQFFLYQPTMSHCYFNVDIKNICCIKLSEFWQPDLAQFDIVNRLNHFLGTYIDYNQAQKYHSHWYSNNFSI